MSELKEQVLSMIRELPDDSTLEDIHYHLYVRAKVERGLKAIDEGRLFTQEEAESKVRPWLKLSGVTPPVI